MAVSLFTDLREARPTTSRKEAGIPIGFLDRGEMELTDSTRVTGPSKLMKMCVKNTGL